MGLAGKVCVVTGASSGIGRRTALDLAAEGARVVACARREERLEALLAEMGGEAGGHSYVVADVSRRDEVRRLEAHVRSTHGRCDVLVNNAGVSNERPFRSPEAIEDVERIMAVNFMGAVYCLGELLPLLEASAPASVVNVASVAGRLATGGNPAYCASKFALVGFTESLHLELARKGIHVSLVEPGLIPTEGFPQTPFVSHPVLRHALGSEAQVSRAIRDAIANRKLQRVTPRWYYLLQIPRLLTPPLYRAAARRLAGMRGPR